MNDAPRTDKEILADVLDAAQGVLDFGGAPLERDREAYETHASVLRALIAKHES